MSQSPGAASVLAEPKKAHDLLAVEEGAVVSRTLVDRPTGTVTLFAFDRDQGLSEHHAPYDALVEVLEGELEITVNGRPFYVKSGEFLLIPAQVPHALRAKSPTMMLLTMVRS